MTKDVVESEAIAELVKDILLLPTTKAKRLDALRAELNGKALDEEVLKMAYENFNKRVIAKGNFPHMKTWQELYLVKEIKKYVNVNIETSIWIGPHCIDVFIPAYGCAIELNGSIHHHEIKMRKDKQRDRTLMKRIGISVMEIENEDLARVKYKIIEFLRDQKRIDSKKIKRIWRDIYINTLCRCFSTDDLSYLTGLDLMYIAKKIGYLPQSHMKLVGAKI